MRALRGRLATTAPRSALSASAAQVATAVRPRSPSTTRRARRLRSARTSRRGGPRGTPPFHEHPPSQAAIHPELADYVGLALEPKKELAKIAAFDPALIEEGNRLVLALRERSATRLRGRNGESSLLLTQRNRLAALLMQRIGRVRAAARYIFRHHDDLVRQVTSAYQRRRRAAARRRDADVTEPVAPMPVMPPIIGSDTILAPS